MSMANRDRHVALLEVVEFAKSKGFKKAEMAFWDPECADNGHTDIEECLMDHDSGTHAIEVGVYLHTEINYTKTVTPEDVETDSKEVVEPSGGFAP